MVETRKRKNHLSDDKSLPITGSSQPGEAAVSDDAEEETRPQPKACKKEDVESSPVTTKTRKSSADSGPHVCKFCNKYFKKSEALGGHMNRHKAEKEDERLENARALVARTQVQYPGLGNPCTMQGGGGNPSYDPTLYFSPPGPGLSSSSRQFYLPNQPAATPHNPQLNQVWAPQQNAQVPMHPSFQGGYYYPLDNTRTHCGTPSQRNIFSTGAQSQEQHQTCESMQHSGANTEEFHHGQSVYNQGGLSDTLNPNLNISSSHNQQTQQANIVLAPGDYSFGQSADLQFVDALLQHEFQPPPGHDSQALPPLENSTQTDVSLPYGASLRNEPSESIRSEHISSTQAWEYGNLASLDASQGGTDQDIDYTLMGSEQYSFDDHTLGKLP